VLVVDSDVTGADGLVGGIDDVTTCDDEGVGEMLDGASVTLEETTSDVRGGVGDDVNVGTCDVSTGVGEIMDEVSKTLAVGVVGTTGVLVARTADVDVTSANTDDLVITSELNSTVTEWLLTITKLLLTLSDAVSDVGDVVIDDGSDTTILERMVVTATEGGTVTLTV
jgi:hypothetical protein